MSVARRLLLLIAALLSMTACAADAEDEELTAEDAAELRNTNAGRVHVYSNNIENMIFDWRDLVFYMKEQNQRPDIFLVQQSGDKERLDDLVRAMNGILGVKYEGRIAQAKPTHTRRRNEVKPAPPSTTAIIYRTARFEFKSKDSWFPLGVGQAGEASADCSKRTNDSGHETLLVRLRDKLAKKDVTAVSLRFWTHNPCPTQNLKDMAGRFGDSDLLVVGGDFNTSARRSEGGLSCWYRAAVRSLEACEGKPDYRFSDVLFDHCKGNKDCIRKQGGIDYLMGRRKGEVVDTSGYDEVSRGGADAADRRAGGTDQSSNTKVRDGFTDVADFYSSHPAQSAFFHY